MILNTDYWQGRNNLERDIYFSSTIYTLANGGVIAPNTPIDESVFPFGSILDQLSVPLFVRVENVGDGAFKFTKRYYKPQINNYVPCVNYTGVPSEPAEWTAISTDYRQGMSATISNTLNIAPIIEMKTKYFCSSVMVGYRTISNIETDGEGNKVFTFSDYREIGYDVFVRDVSPAFDLGTVIVTDMWLINYYGDGQSRTNVTSNRVDILCSMGNTSFGLEQDIVDEYVLDTNTDRQLLMPISMSSGYNKSLIQGGYRNVADISLGYSKICVFPRANPLFWKIGRIKTSSGRDCPITAYIDNMTDLMLAFKAYRATGYNYFSNANDAMSYNLDNIDPNNPPERGSANSEGTINGSQNAGGNDTGLQTDPTKMQDTGYNGNDNVDTNNYVDETPLTKPTLSTVNAFNRTFAVNYTAIRGLADWLWNADESVFDEIVAGLGLMGERPIEGIIDIRLYPFDVATLLTTAGEDVIRIGRTDSPVSGLVVGTADNAIIDLGSCTFTKKFKSFLDYSPYTEARLYIPYCGVIPIDTAEFMGHEISAKMIVDIVTGACTVLIYKDKIITYYAQGTCGVSIPFTGTDSAQFAQSVLGSVVNGTIDVVGGAMSKDAGKVIAGASELYSGFAAPVQYATGGSSTPSCGNWQPQYAYFIIDRPEPIPPDDYGHCVGYACEIYAPLSTFSGYTVINNPDLSGIGATETEKEEIKRLLQEGVYL